MRGFAMALFLGAAIALPISKSGFGASEIMTSSSWSPQVLEHRTIDATATPLNSWSVKSVAKRVAASVLPRSPFSCCHEAADYPSSNTGGVLTYGPTVDNGEDNNTTPPIQARNASFWGRATNDTPRNAHKGAITTRDTATIQARSPQTPTFWGPAHVDDTPANAEKAPASTLETPAIQARSPQTPTFWGPAHVDDTPADAEKGPATISETSPIQARNASFWRRDHMDATRAAAEKRTAVTSDAGAIEARSPQAPTFWGPSHVDDTPADAEDSAGSLDTGDTIIETGEESA